MQTTLKKYRNENRSAGIISLPPGSRGPRSLYLRRYGDSFGFTLRHFIVFPPDSLTVDVRHAAVGALLAPMDTIFVKHVALHSPAEQAGLQKGDRVVAVNGVSVTDKKYAQVVHLIQNSPEYLHLLVVPKEEDVLQKFFAETAHNPISNQPQRAQEIIYGDRRRSQRSIPRGGFQVDANSWQTLQETVRGTCNQRGKEDIDECQRRLRAQPQVSLYRKMGRRASEGSSLSNPYEYLDEKGDEMVVGESDGKGVATPRAGQTVSNYSNMAGNRLSLDGRRQSSSSLSSSLADGSKDSLSSYDSVSTLTGQDTDDSAIMNRLRQSFQKKEEFMRRPSQHTDANLIPREFYGRPKRLDKPLWPPREGSPSRTVKPVHQNFQRVKSDIDSERDHGQFIPGGTVNNFPLQKGAKSPKDWPFIPTGLQICEGSPAPSSFDNSNQINGSSSDEDRRSYLTNLQMVSKRTRQFEAGRPLPEDDPKDRTSFYRSELARLSSKHIDPNVTIRAHEFEAKVNEPRRDNSGSTTNSSGMRRQHRDSRSLDSSGSNDSSSSVNEILDKKLSGNVTIPSGSKYIHVPPPGDNRHPKDILQDLDNVSPSRMRARSNSADSWAAAMHSEKKEDIDAEDEQVRQLLQEAMDVAQRSEKTVRTSRTSPLIPEPVERLHMNPAVSITPVPFSSPPLRPTQLDLCGPVRPARRQSGRTSPRRPLSPVNTTDPNKPVVVRRIKNTNLAEEERAMRRESYLKATGNGRMHVDELSDGEVSPVNRRGSTSGGSSSSASLEREKSSIPSSPLEKDRTIKEGYLHCKIAETDGKRAADRSWKQVWAVLRGSKLFLYKDRHHQSPADAAEQSLNNGVDVRASRVSVAEDYTKRKHVLRIAGTRPCRSELLLQAENPIDLAGWVKALQEQTVSTDPEEKSDSVKQSAARLSPQPSKSKLPSLRNRSPTGQSPVSKTRKPSQTSETLSSPKSKTWRGRMAKQFRKIQGASSPSSPTAPEGSTFCVPLEHCIPSNGNQYVPRLVEVCTDIVENKGLDIVGVYRVPGNNAAITALSNSVNQNYEQVPRFEVQWNDVHVVSSLLKAFFRKLPDALLSFGLYSSFIEADKVEDPRLRMEEIKRLINKLPPWHYHTLRHLMLHLNTVTKHSDVNKMKASNLAIIFGPTLIRDSQDDMATLVNDMSHNYKIVESLICHADWFFSDEDACSLSFAVAPAVDPMNNEIEPAATRALLLDNISKVEGLRGDQKERREIFSSIICAAQRKMRKGAKAVVASLESKEELGSPNGIKEFSYPNSPPANMKDALTDDKNNIIPTTVIDMERSTNKPPEKVPWFNYSDQDHFRQRIQNFIQETQAHLQRNKKSIDYYDDVLDSKFSDTSSQKSSEFSSTFPKTNCPDPRTITKTHSASNVFYRNANPPTNDNVRNSANSALTMKYDFHDYGKNTAYDLNRNKERLGNSFGNFPSAPKNKVAVKSIVENTGPKPFSLEKSAMRRGSSVENLNSSTVDLSANGGLKKIKFGNEIESGPRTGSLDSIHKMPEVDDGSDLQASIMRIFDEKKMKVLNPLSGSGLPFADESPERQPPTAFHPKQNVPASPKLYRNPSLHKSLLASSKLCSEAKESQKIVEEEKEKDSSETVPDNERHISSATKNVGKLRRSESLNKERTVSPHKLKRSESLNKASDKLKRSDSLTKNEKTESNLSKRRENSRRSKEFKLKRKNGMPERSIKRRHTVGGTKDFDKVNWLDNRNRDENCNDKENVEEKKKSSLRTSSPDLSSTRRERLFLEVNLIGPENMVVALRQHLIGARPQSLPEPRIFTVPLESHV